jgi:hypothetical protein
MTGLVLFLSVHLKKKIQSFTNIFRETFQNRFIFDDLWKKKLARANNINKNNKSKIF